jgi:hypothetical protein
MHIQSQCQVKISGVQILQHTSATFKIVVIYWIYLMACKYLSWSLLKGWSCDNQGISLVDHFIWVHMSWLNWIYMQCCLLWVDWMDICLMKVFKQVSFKFDSIWWSIAQCIEICPLLKIWAIWDQVWVWVTKSYWIGLKFGMHALDLWYEMLYKFHDNWMRNAMVLEHILSAIVQQFSACSSGGRFEIW